VCRALRAHCLATGFPLDPHVCLIRHEACQTLSGRATFNQRVPRHPHSSFILHTNSSAPSIRIRRTITGDCCAPRRVLNSPSEDLPAIARASRSSIDYKHGIAQLATSIWIKDVMREHLKTIINQVYYLPQATTLPTQTLNQDVRPRG
jgi:hypothetical protein